MDVDVDMDIEVDVDVDVRVGGKDVWVKGKSDNIGVNVTT